MAKNSSEEKREEQEEEDFEFKLGSWGGSLLTESEMCAADDVFFQGQILPLRLSVSSDSRNPSKSESMDHSSSGGSRSSSSSSSSHQYSSGSNSSTTITNKHRERNQFHTHPSPKPQIWVFGARPENVSSRSRESTIWGFFRLGLVRMPETELKDLKLRNNKKSLGSGSSNSCSGKNSSHEMKLEKKKRQRLVEKKSGFMSGCKCSVSAVGTVSSRIVISKNKVSE